MFSGFKHIHEHAQKIIKQGRNWRQWVLCDRDPVEKWTDGRVVLLGDAAHPMLQYYAQGACMALEDAVCIAYTVEKNSGDIEKAFKNYNDLRIIRTGRVQLGARVIGDHIYHPAGAHALIRNSVMQSMTTNDYYDQLEWLYGSTGIEDQ